MRRVLLPFLFLFAVMVCWAQAPATVSGTTAAVPPLIKFSGTLANTQGTVGVIFALYADQTGGAPLWLEIQNVTPDANGRYTVYLGVNHANGVPLDVFASAEARWLGVQPEGQAEQPRVQLVSVPYSLKAAKATDADTLGGQPLSAFVLASNAGTTTGTGSGTVTANAGSGVLALASPQVGSSPVNTSGAALPNYMAKFSTSTDVEPSTVIYDTGAAVGIGTTAPQAILHVVSPTSTAGMIDAYSGASTTSLGALPMVSRAARGTAGSPSAVKTNDYLGGLGARAYTGTTFTGGWRAAVLLRADQDWTDSAQGTNIAFGVTAPNTTAQKQVMWLTSGGALGIGINTPGALLEVNGTAKFDGLVTFASGQTFPGTNVNITSPGGSITVGGTSSAPTLNLNTSYTNALYAPIVGSTSYAPASGSTNYVSPSALSAYATLAANTFSGNQSAPNLIATGNVTAAAAVIGGDAALSSAPRMYLNAAFPGAVDANWTAAHLVPDKPITITRITFDLKAAATSSCDPQPQIQVVSGVNSFFIPLAGTFAAYDTGVISLPFAAGTNIAVKAVLGSNCPTSYAPQSGNLEAEYRMGNASDTLNCGATYTKCGGNCTNLQSDTADCGACGTACTPANGTGSCHSGACAIASCNQGYANCNGAASDGCETNTNTSMANCGACGQVCSRANAGATCVTGACGISSCNSGWGNCDGLDANGCETPLNTLTNCSACGTTCSLANATATCATGACAISVCNTWYADCDANPINGCETNINTSVANCGMCGKACPAVVNGTPACAGGLCGVGACNTGWADCDKNSANGCETNLNTSVSNCGSCGYACPGGVTNGTAVCVNQACGVLCNSGYTNCSGLCKNLTNDSTSCGSCGTVCPINSVCNASTCVCTANCPTGTSCTGGSSCSSGVCLGGMCAAATCSDLRQNGNETDVDCGGTTCPTCAPGKSCLVWSDCQSGVCSGGKCTAATCTDMVKNGNETDVDCGGGTCPNCAAGKSCKVNTDCVNNSCSGGVCVGQATGTACTAASQCVSGYCANGFCCNTACLGTCMACSAAISGFPNGTCANFPEGTPNSQCTTAPYACNGNGNCQ